MHGLGAIQVPADAAEAMKPLAGQYAFILFAAGLFNASLFAASILAAFDRIYRVRRHGFESGWIRASAKRLHFTGSTRC